MLGDVQASRFRVLEHPKPPPWFETRPQGVHQFLTPHIQRGLMSGDTSWAVATHSRASHAPYGPYDSPRPCSLRPCRVRTAFLLYSLTELGLGAPVGFNNNKAWTRYLPLIFIIAVTLSGCAAQRQQSRMKHALSAYIGTSVANFMAEHGTPTSSVELAPGRRAFRWVITGRGAGGIVPVAGSLVVVPPRDLVCTVTLTATTSAKVPAYWNWIITGYSWQGNC